MSESNHDLEPAKLGGELLGELKNVVEQVFTTMLSTVAELVGNCESKASGPPGDRKVIELPSAEGKVLRSAVDIEASVPFSGARQGQIVLRCTMEGANDIARGLLMMDKEETVHLDEVRDALGECANMLMGTLKTQVLDPKGEFTMGMPTVETHLAIDHTTCVGELVYRLAEGCAAMEVWVDE